MSATGGELEAKLRVSLTGQDELLAFYNKSTAGVKSFRSATNAELNRLGQDIAGFASKTARALGTLGGLGAAVSVGAQAKGVLDLRDAIAGLASTAGLGEDSLVGLRKQILSTSLATNQLGMDVTEALNAFVAKTGDIETGRKNLELYGKTATAARAAMADIANIGAEMPKLGITDQATALAILAKQSDVGAVELKDLVKEGPRLLSSFQGAGLRGIAGLREGGAFAQMAMKGTGNVDMATTAVEAAFRDIAIHHDRVESAGINVYDPKSGLALNRMDVIKQLIQKSGGREGLLTLSRGGGVFDSEGMRAIRPLIQDYLANGGKFSTYDAFRDVSGDQSIIDRKYALNSNTGLAKIKQAQIRMQAATDRNFGDTIESVAGAGSSFVGSAYETAMAHPFLVGGGLLAGRSALRMGMAALRGGRATSGIAGSITSALTGSGGVGVPVAVTNWPEGFGGKGGAAAAIGEAIADKAKLGLLPRAVAALGGNAGLLAMGAGIAGTLAASVSIVSKLNNAMPQIRQETEDQLRAHRKQIDDNEVGKGQAAGDLMLGTFGRFGGAFTASQARAARQGMGSYGRSAGDVLSAFGQQQQSLDLLARSEEGGVGEDLIRSDPQYALILDALNATNPAFKTAKSGKDKAAILRGLIAGNDQESYRTPEQPLVDDGAQAASPGLPYMFGLEKTLGGAGDTAQQMAAAFKEMLGLNITINIDGEGNATVESDGTRAPKIMARRTSGAN